MIDDPLPRPGALNMAIDEALLHTTPLPVLRFYRWNGPSVSFGYFGQFEKARRCAASRTLVRRWTGGGIVFHGDDLTYSIVIPASDLVFADTPMSIYEKVHCALRDALVSLKQHAVLASGVEPGAAASARGYNGHCFANPVCADVIVNGRKIAGAAQRTTCERSGYPCRSGTRHCNDIARLDGRRQCLRWNGPRRTAHLDGRSQGTASASSGARIWAKLL